MPCRATQDSQIIVKSFDKTWTTGGGNGKPLQHTCCKNPMNSMMKQKDMILEDELHRCEGAQYTTREEQRVITDSSKRNEVAGTKQK